MCCVVFCSVFQRYFILLFRSTHTCTWRASWVRVEQSPSCVLFSFLFRTKRKGYAGLGQEIAWFMRPPMSPIIHWCHLACFTAYPSPAAARQVNSISPSTAWNSGQISFFLSGPSVCLGSGNCSRIRNWAGQIHASIANSPVLGTIRYLEQCVAITAVRTQGQQLLLRNNNPTVSKKDLPRPSASVNLWHWHVVEGFLQFSGTVVRETNYSIYYLRILGLSTKYLLSNLFILAFREYCIYKNELTYNRMLSTSFWFHCKSIFLDDCSFFGSEITTTYVEDIVIAVHIYL